MYGIWLSINDGGAWAHYPEHDNHWVPTLMSCETGGGVIACNTKTQAEQLKAIMFKPPWPNAKCPANVKVKEIA